MALQRLIPALLISESKLVKTVRFKNPIYIGDPLNTLRIFNLLEVDELCFLNIEASRKRIHPDLNLLSELSEYAFMPLSYGGGIHDAGLALEIIKMGFEKIIVGTAAFKKPDEVRKMVEMLGSQSVVGALDVRKDYWGRRRVYIQGGTKVLKITPYDACEYLQTLGIGEILITDISREGTWAGLDFNLFEDLLKNLKIPVIIHGGAKEKWDLQKALSLKGVSGVAIGNLAVFQKKGAGILLGYPHVERQFIIQ